VAERLGPPHIYEWVAYKKTSSFLPSMTFGHKFYLMHDAMGHAKSAYLPWRKLFMSLKKE
jgi:hypothetical protein